MRLAALDQPINTKADCKDGKTCAGDRSWRAAYMTLAIMIAVGLRGFGCFRRADHEGGAERQQGRCCKGLHMEPQFK